MRVKVTSALASQAINESPWENGKTLTPEQNEALADMAKCGFHIIVHPDGAVELRRE